MHRSIAVIAALAAACLLAGSPVRGQGAPEMPSPGSAASGASGAGVSPGTGAKTSRPRAPSVPEGIRLEASSRKLLESEKGPEGEVKALLTAAGTLKTEKALRYRASVLPPGTYPVSVRTAGDDGKGLVVVIGPAAAAPAAAREGKLETRLEAKPEEMPEEKEPAKGEKPAAGAGGRARGGKRSAPREPAAPPRIRAPLRVGRAAKATDTLDLAIRSAAGGSRVALILHGGLEPREGDPPAPRLTVPGSEAGAPGPARGRPGARRPTEGRRGCS